MKQEYNQLQELLTKLPEETSHDIMVPVSKVAFFPGSIVHTNEILVSLGDNWFVERTSFQAVDIISRRKRQIDENMTKKNQELKELNEKIGVVHQIKGTTGDLVNIAEEYDANSNLISSNLPMYPTEKDKPKNPFEVQSKQQQPIKQQQQQPKQQPKQQSKQQSKQQPKQQLKQSPKSGEVKKEVIDEKKEKVDEKKEKIDEKKLRELEFEAFAKRAKELEKLEEEEMVVIEKEIEKEKEKEKEKKSSFEVINFETLKIENPSDIFTTMLSIRETTGIQTDIQKEHESSENSASSTEGEEEEDHDEQQEEIHEPSEELKKKKRVSFSEEVIQKDLLKTEKLEAKLAKKNKKKQKGKKNQNQNQNQNKDQNKDQNQNQSTNPPTNVVVQEETNKQIATHDDTLQIKLEDDVFAPEQLQFHNLAEMNDQDDLHLSEVKSFELIFLVLF